VTLTNTGDDATTADISKNGVLVGDDVAVPVGGSTFPVALVDADENTDVTITVDFAAGTDPAPIVIAVDCEHPAISSVALECAEGGVVVVLTNDGVLPTVVLVNGVAIDVPAGAGSAEDNPAIRVVVPVDEDAAYDFTVVGDDLEQVFSGTANCLLPEPSVDDEVVCAATGLSIVLRNTGDDSATYVVTSSALPDGATEATVDAGDVETVLIPLAEGASTDVLVTSDDAVLFDATILRDCETVQGEVIRPPAALPRTGSNILGLLTLAGALLLVGSTLIAGARRRSARVLS
jgi:LPXTG-motif cell wall-anchored protein